MNIGIICYASVGGSGIVATELAKCLATRGHEVHLISSETPFRLGNYQAGLSFHSVQQPSYPLFRESQYLLPLTNKIVQLSRDVGLDLIHAHYAIPHATAAYLAREIILATDSSVRAPKVITTLHGTDITLLGSDPSYSEAVAFSIDESDGVTAVSESLKASTKRTLPVTSDIRVIPNFVDCQTTRRHSSEKLRDVFCPQPFEHLVVHVSNFRPVKRVEAVIKIFRMIRDRVNARLLLVGEGEDLNRVRQLVRELGLFDCVEVLGEQDQIVPILSVADLFLLPSSEESFGLAALEAAACEVPVVASKVGGLTEVFEHGRTAFLHAPKELEKMTDSAIRLLNNGCLRAEMTRAARRVVETRYCLETVVPQYEQFYTEVLTGTVCPPARLNHRASARKSPAY